MKGRAPAPAVDLAALPKMKLSDLHDLWHAHFGRKEPPQRRIIVRELAYRVQAQRDGGMDAATRRLLQKAMRSATAKNAREQSVVPQDGNTPRRFRRTPDRTPPSPLPPGSRIVRVWRGRTYEVTVVDGGRAFRYRDRTYTSLSVLAFEITGSKRSGPRFFGLVSGRSAPETSEAGLAARRAVVGGGP